MSCFIKRARTLVFAFALYALLASPALGDTVIWQANGQIYGVAGPMKATDLRKLAETLK